jgi:hypothetical protein
MGHVIRIYPDCDIRECDNPSWDMLLGYTQIVILESVTVRGSECHRQWAVGTCRLGIPDEGAWEM